MESIVFVDVFSSPPRYYVSWKPTTCHHSENPTLSAIAAPPPPPHWIGSRLSSCFRKSRVAKAVGDMVVIEWENSWVNESDEVKALMKSSPPPLFPQRPINCVQDPRRVRDVSVLNFEIRGEVSTIDDIARQAECVIKWHDVVAPDVETVEGLSVLYNDDGVVTRARVKHIALNDEKKLGSFFEQHFPVVYDEVKILIQRAADEVLLSTPLC